MNFDVQTLRAFAATLEEVLPEALEEVRARHPLLRQVPLVGVRQVVVPADVDSADLAMATYEIPLLASGVSLKLDGAISSVDRLVEVARDIIRPTVREYERSLRTGLYSPTNGFLGVGGLLPSDTGTNVIAGISEVTTPGWRSQVTQTHTTVYDAFVASESRCMRRGKAPDLTVLGTRAYAKLVAGMQPQQRFTKIRRGIAMLALHSGTIFHDPFCATEAGYMVHTEDFGFHASPFDVVAEIGLDGRIRVLVRRREQMIASRRFRSGVITPPPAYSVD